MNNDINWEIIPQADHFLKPEFGVAVPGTLVWPNIAPEVYHKYSIQGNISYLLFHMLQPLQPDLLTDITDTYDVDLIKMLLFAYLKARIPVHLPPQLKCLDLSQHHSLQHFCGGTNMTSWNEICYHIRRHILPRRVQFRNLGHAPTQEISTSF